MAGSTVYRMSMARKSDWVSRTEGRDVNGVFPTEMVNQWGETMHASSLEQAT